MNEKPETQPDDSNEEIEREMRRSRKFSMSEAIGEIAGGDFMKGGSPVSRQQQSELEIDEFLRRHLIDPGGVLRSVLLRHIGDGLLTSDDQPLVALAEYIKSVLVSEPLLEGLVREADAQWGRVFDERPYFEQPTRLPHPDDPYTLDSVRVSLLQLREGLTSGKI